MPFYSPYSWIWLCPHCGQGYGIQNNKPLSPADVDTLGKVLEKHGCATCKQKTPLKELKEDYKTQFKAREMMRKLSNTDAAKELFEKYRLE